MLHEDGPPSVGVHKVLADDEVEAVAAEGVQIVRQHHVRARRVEVRGEADDGRGVLVAAAAPALLRCAGVHAACNAPVMT